ncbi:MAG: hypothetical protein AB7F25_14240 [Deferribacterales bacterium]
MLKKLSLFALLSLFLVGLYGCGGSSSSSDEASEITVKTTIEMGGTKAAAKDAVDMVVTLTLPDGTEVRMTSTGNGNEYSCSVAYTEGDPVFIKAVYGDLVLKNFFESIDTSGDTADLGATTPVTTLFVDVLESMVETMDSGVTSQNVITHLLAGVKEATLGINVTTVKEEVTDTGNAAYTTLQQAYTAAITWDNAGNAQAYDTALQQVETTVEVGGIEIPITENEQETIEQMAANLVQSYFAGDAAALAAMMYSDGFLDNGYNSETFLADVTAEHDDIPAGVTVSVVSNDAVAVKMTSSDPVFSTLSPLGILMYRIYMSNHIQGKISNQVVYEEAYDDQKAGDAGMVLQKINGKWYLRGNQEKVEFWTSLTTDVNWQSRYVYAEVCQGGTDVSSASVTSNAFTGSVSMTENPYDTECKSVQIFENGQVWGWDGSQFVQTGTVTFSAENLCGKTLTYSIALADSTTATKTVTLPACVEKTVSVSAVKNNDGSVTVSYTLPVDEDVSSVSIHVTKRQSGDLNSQDVLDKENLPFASTAYTFDSGLFETGYIYEFRLRYEDKYARQYIPVVAEVTY